MRVDVSLGRFVRRMGGWTGGTSVRRSARRLVGRFNCGTQGAGRAARPPGEYWQSSIRCSTSLGAACLLHEEWQSSFTAAGARNAPSWARNEAQQSSFGLDAARRRWFGPGMRLSNPQSARRAVAARPTPPRASRRATRRRAPAATLGRRAPTPRASKRPRPDPAPARRPVAHLLASGLAVSDIVVARGNVRAQ